MKGLECDVLIAGGGPVGLYMGCLLLQNGVSCRVLEKRTSPSRHTRSIGIHPPALERLSEIGVAEELIRLGIPVREGLAFANLKYIGRLSFESVPSPFRFVLALPQYETERVLEKRLKELDPGALIHGAEVLYVREEPELVVATVAIAGMKTDFRTRFVAGCDGQHSVVRRSSGIDFPGGNYAATFSMGDFDDETDLGPRAAIFLSDRGVVESFPLPGASRRWVVLRNHGECATNAETLILDIFRRTGHAVSADSCSMLSDFAASHFLATRMARGRIVLAGDAAHVVSPIGGQGMNLGWLDARIIAAFLSQAVRTGSSAEDLLDVYDRVRRRSALRARKRAEFNMFVGGISRLPSLKYLAVSAALRTPARTYFARRFTMHGL